MSGGQPKHQRALSRFDGLNQRVIAWADRLEEKRRAGVVVATVKRFFSIDGIDQSALLALELFTTVIPLAIIGFSYATHFSNKADIGNLFIRETGIGSPYDETVRQTFGSSANVYSAVGVIGILSFLVWGVPMSMTVARMFALAWRREQFGLGTRIWRGATWFLLFLVAAGLGQAILNAHFLRGGTIVVPFVLSMLPMFVFWMFTPVFLVNGGASGWKFLVYSGLAGVVIQGVFLRLAARVFIPMILEGWSGFGPIGVAMTMMTWCGVLGTGWTIAACAGAVMWERHAPDAVVAFTETGDVVE